jgi:hypothetical protein
MMRMAQALDRPQDEQKYRETFEKVRTAFNQNMSSPMARSEPAARPVMFWPCT